MVAAIAQPARIAPTLLSAWKNYGLANVDAAYWKDTTGYVHIEGLVSGDSAPNESAIFILPEGYRPPKDIIVSCAASAGYGDVTIVASTGEVRHRSDLKTYFSLSNIIFRPI